VITIREVTRPLIRTPSQEWVGTICAAQGPMSKVRGPHPDGTAVSGDQRAGTIAAPDEPSSPRSFAEVFAAIFPGLAELHASFRKDGVLAVAVWRGEELADYVHIVLAGDPQFALVGRHQRCDLSVSRDPALSLRHAVIAARVASGELRLRFLDLLSGSGLVTEDGHRCEALAADGAMFVRLGDYHLFLLPTGTLSPLAWAATAADTWRMIPERIYRDNRVAARLPGAGRGGRVALPSVATRLLEPPGALRPYRPEAGARGTPVADIELRTSSGSERYTLHEADLERGMLLGRYDRCQLGVADDRMSRIHLLIVRNGEDVWAVDTASTNGTTVAGRSVRSVRLDERTRLVLGREVSLRWEPVSSPVGGGSGTGSSS
jgi:hypothetical protein